MLKQVQHDDKEERIKKGRDSHRDLFTIYTMKNAQF